MKTKFQHFALVIILALVGIAGNVAAQESVAVPDVYKRQYP